MQSLRLKHSKEEGYAVPWSFWPKGLTSTCAPCLRCVPDANIPAANTDAAPSFLSVSVVLLADSPTRASSSLGCLGILSSGPRTPLAHETQNICCLTLGREGLPI